VSGQEGNRGNTLKAVVQTGYGSADVMELREIEKPTGSAQPDQRIGQNTRLVG
jgi:hypothetical protein